IVGRGLAPAETTGIEYTAFGEIAEKQLFLLEDRYPYLAVDQFVIMPNHIHAIMILNGGAAGASPRPTITDIVCAYLSSRRPRQTLKNLPGLSICLLRSKSTLYKLTYL
ncbi:MAG: hypothetical protein SPJ23_05295, partial [Eubacteriales bacterium]|nr:hypothetical protein [Eubacteriales bacterium]